MSENSLTRRRFIRLGAGAAALSAAPATPALYPSASEASDLGRTHKHGTHAEMSLAQAWARAFRLPSAESAATETRLLPAMLKPPFSFVYDGRASRDLLPGWRYEAQDIDLAEGKQQQELTYSDPHSGLRVRATATVFEDFPAVEWVMHFENRGSADTAILENIQALDVELSTSELDPVIYYANGARCSASDFMPLTRVLGTHGSLHLQPGGGRSSSQFLPFFNLEAGGEGAILAIGWSGEWAVDFRHLETSPHLQVKAGMALTHLLLHPGERIRTPRILLLFWQGDRIRGHNLVRQFILAHHRPADQNRPLLAPLSNHNWGGTPAVDHLQNIRHIVAHDLPMDYYWIDAEWFGDGPWWRNVGNWEPNRVLYPQGFKPISDLLHASGRKLLLWFEPERVCEGTPWYRDHQSWLLEVPPDKRVYRGFAAGPAWDFPQSDPRWVPNESDRNQIQENDRLFNLAIPEARQFLTDFISRKIDEFGVDCFRNDSNIAPLEFWRAADSSDRQGITEIAWIEGLYAFWDELLGRHPHLLIDDCASGGRRIDLETIGRSMALSRTDFVGDLIANQCHSYGLNFWIPLAATSAGNLSTGNDYRIRSSMTAGLGYGLFTSGDRAQLPAHFEAFPFAEVKTSLEHYRSLQRYFYGDYYPLTEYSASGDAWVAYQLNLPDQDEGLVVVLKRPSSNYRLAVFPLRALRKNVLYQVTNLDTQETRGVSGRELGDTGIEVRLPRSPDSALFAYRRRS